MRLPDTLLHAVQPVLPAQDIVLDTADWKSFTYPELFTMARGKSGSKAVRIPGDTLLVSASRDNNGVTDGVADSPSFPAGCITVANNGNSVGEAFVQLEPFCASSDVTVLVPKEEISIEARLFMCTLVRAEQYRYNYGRKWSLTLMRKSTMSLPALPDGTPDWPWIDAFIQSLPFSRIALASDDPESGTVREELAEVLG